MTNFERTAALFAGCWVAIFGFATLACNCGGPTETAERCTRGTSSNPSSVETGNLQVVVGRWAGSGGAALMPPADADADGTDAMDVADGTPQGPDALDTLIVDADGTVDVDGTVDGTADASDSGTFDVGGDGEVADVVDSGRDGGDTSRRRDIWTPPDTGRSDTSWVPDTGEGEPWWSFSGPPAWENTPACERGATQSCSGFLPDPEYQIFHGNQGGFHFFPAVKISNVDAESFTATVVFELFTKSGRSVAGPVCRSVPKELWGQSGNGWAWHEPRLVFSGGATSSSWDGREAVVVVDVEVAGEREVVARRAKFHD